MRAVGKILAVQEQRFRLLTEEGQVYLLTLGHDARLETKALSELQQQQARVSVGFTGEPNLRGCVASEVEPIAR